MVDDHPMMRAGLAQLINRQPDMLVCGEAGQPAEALALCSRAAPDLVLTDLTMPGRGGIEFLKDLKAQRADLPILVISMHDEMVYAERCFRAGASGYLMKESGSEKLLAAPAPRHRRADVRQSPGVGGNSAQSFRAQAARFHLAHSIAQRPGIRGLPTGGPGQEHARDCRPACT